MQATADVKPLVLDYLKAFDSRDLERCLSFCNEDATFHFLWRSFRGLKGIEKWHRDRFAADLRVVRVDDISAEGNTVTVDVIIASNKLRARKVNQIGGRITLRLERGALKDVKFGHRKPGKSGAGEFTDASLYRSYVGPADNYDVAAAMQFNLLTFLGLRDEHYLLDVGCGSLRAGRLFIPYLRPGRYFGMEPEQWLIEEGIKNEIGQDLIRIKQPTFSNDPDFTLTVFRQQFDFILAQSIFSHTSQTQMRRCLSEARKAMQPSAIFAATYFKGETNYTGEEWVYPGRSSFRPDLMDRLAEEQGLVCKHLDWPHPHGQSWVVFAGSSAASAMPDLTGISEYSNYKGMAPWDGTEEAGA
jgi:ketosteroid isomerase-like protein